RIQQAVAKRNKENPLLDFPVTLSIGAAHWEPKDDLTIEQVLARADEKMYEEKGKRSTGVSPK
ncbi:diguanylate cyclase, partial [Candidatus Bipolaricaulota bacterium]|nr:diguanylate cyclase [Candidatus Bipolaricaulota bacterium]